MFLEDEVYSILFRQDIPYLLLKCREVEEERHGSCEAGATAHGICSMAPVREKRDAGMTHTVT